MWERKREIERTHSINQQGKKSCSALSSSAGTFCKYLNKSENNIETIWRTLKGLNTLNIGGKKSFRFGIFLCKSLFFEFIFNDFFYIDYSLFSYRSYSFFWWTPSFMPTQFSTLYFWSLYIVDASCSYHRKPRTFNIDVHSIKQVLNPQLAQVSLLGFTINPPSEKNSYNKVSSFAFSSNHLTWIAYSLLTA